MKKIEKLLASDSFINFVHRRNADDVAQWKKWIKENPEHEELVERSTLVVQSLRFNQDKLDEAATADEWQKLQLRIRKEAYTVRYTDTQRNIFIYRLLAACTAVLAIAGLWFQFLYNPRTVIETGTAQKTMIKLPDDSEVTLNQNSSISFLSSWDKDTVRQVWLEGEGYFRINRELGENGVYKRFEVHTDELVIEVLGTVFSVNTFKDYVTLESGRVDLRRKGEAEVYTLLPGQTAKINELGDIEMSEAKAGPHISWLDGKISLDNNSLGEIIAFIESSYGLEVQCEGSETLQRNLSGQIRVDNLDDLLAVLEKVLDLVIIKDKDKIKILEIKKQ